MVSLPNYLQKFEMQDQKDAFRIAAQQRPARVCDEAHPRAAGREF